MRKSKILFCMIRSWGKSNDKNTTFRLAVKDETVSQYVSGSLRNERNTRRPETAGSIFKLRLKNMDFLVYTTRGSRITRFPTVVTVIELLTPTNITPGGRIKNHLPSSTSPPDRFLRRTLILIVSPRLTCFLAVLIVV